MTATETQSEQAELIHAISAIQSEWSPRERTRRQLLAELRQRRLMQMLSPQPRREAYDCSCDLAGEFSDTATNEGAQVRRSRRYVLVDD